MNLSLFQKVNSNHVTLDPFPHLVIENALPEELHQELRHTFPSIETLGLTLGQNQRWSTTASELREIDGIAPLWRRFVEYHASKEFLEDVLQIFGNAIVEMYPTSFKSVEDIRKRPVIVRSSEGLVPDSLSLDAQVSGNSPVTHSGAPRGIHFDSTNALWAGLYYLRNESDDSIGGDLELWKWPNNCGFGKKSSLYHEGMSLKEDLRFRVVPYRSNTFVFIINSIDSLHAVSERMATLHTRRFLNLLCDLPKPLFRPRPLPLDRIKNLMFRKLGLESSD